MGFLTNREGEQTTKRFDCNTNTRVDAIKINKFIKDIVSVYKKHGMSISHEDGHGMFEIAEYDEDNVTWLEEARIQKGFIL